MSIFTKAGSGDGANVPDVGLFFSAGMNALTGHSPVRRLSDCGQILSQVVGYCLYSDYPI